MGRGALMAHLNGQALQTWKKGDQLAATDLNVNFAILADRLERVMAQALLPDPANTDLQMRMRAVVERIDRLEELTAMHARQRNEREWAPLSHLGALVTMVNEVNRRFEDACRRIDEMHASIGVEHDDLHRRLQRLEQQPDAATQDDFTALVRDHDRLALKEHMLLAQIIALRHEVTILRELALGHDREANRKEYAPLSTVGHLLQRIMALEAKA
jgi:hypothetical protein